MVMLIYVATMLSKCEHIYTVNSQWNFIRTSTLFKSLFSTLSLAVNNSPSANNFICGDLESSFPVSSDYIRCTYQYKKHAHHAINWSKSEQAQHT